MVEHTAASLAKRDVKHGGQGVQRNRLGHILFHPRLQATFARTFKGMPGHRDYGGVPLAAFAPIVRASVAPSMPGI